MQSMRDVPALRRAMFGAVAGGACVLPLFVGLWTACAEAGLRMEPYPPGGVPLIVILVAAGAALGVVFGIALPRCGRGWRCGAVLGVLATMALWFVIAPAAGGPMAGGWRLVGMLQTLTVITGWGVGLGFVLPLWLGRRGDGAAPT